MSNNRRWSLVISCMIAFFLVNIPFRKTHFSHSDHELNPDFVEQLTVTNIVNILAQQLNSEHINKTQLKAYLSTTFHISLL